MFFKNKFIKTGRILCRHRSALPIIYIGMIFLYIYMTPPFVFSGNNVISEMLTGLLILLGLRVRWAAENRESNTLASLVEAKGIYSVIRFPFYLSDFLILLGITTFVGSFSLLLVFVLSATIVIERMLMFEERISYNNLGDDYVKWYKSTNAIIPVIWNWRGATYVKSLKSKAQNMLNPIFFALFVLNAIYIYKYYRVNFTFSIDYFLAIPLLILLILLILMRFSKRK